MGEEQEQLTWVNPHLIDPNPFQPKTRTTFTPAQLVDLEDVKERGLLQPFRVRPHPDGNGRYQQHFGHRRLAAWVVYRPGEPIPVFVVEIDDRQMFEHMVAENADRADLSSIEQAELIAAYLEQFKDATQAQAGQLFNLRTQGAVSNKLSLLKLPVEIRKLIQAGTLPERIARALRSLSQVDSKAAVRAAQAVAKAEADERESQLYAELDHYVDKHGESLRWVPWKSRDWPPKPIPSPIGDIPKCLGCTYNVRCDAADPEDRGCINRSCYGAKLKAWAESEAARVSAAHGVTVAGPKEKVSILYDGSDYKKAEFAQSALALGHASLRTIPVYTKIRDTYGLERVTGSGYVILGCVDVSALRKAVAEKSKEPKQPKPKVKLERWEIQQRARLSLERERRKQVRALVSAATPAFAPLVPDPLIDILYDRLRYTHGLADRPAKVEAWKKADAAGRKAMLMGALLDGYVGTSYTPNPETATKKLSELARSAKVKLPRGWDSAPSANSKGPKSKGAKAKPKGAKQK